jgi:hypothetical protein
MKKIFCLLVSLVVLGTASFAQDKTAPKTSTTAKKTTAPKAADVKTPAATTAKTKKDGTPDMRYKENKDAAKPGTKLKKDGTPDMRYKANKDAAKKK